MPFGGRNPFEELEELFERMSKEFDTGFEGRFSPIPVDIAETPDAYVVTAEVPGIEREDIDVSIVNNSLRLSVEISEEEPDEGTRYLRRERRSKLGSRSVDLPGDIDQDGIEATLAMGLLGVTVPKVDPEDAGKKIDIE